MDKIDENNVALPRKIMGAINRPLDDADIEVIFRDAGPWWLFYALLLLTGLPCKKVALLLHGNVDREKSALIIQGRRRGEQLAIPIVPQLMGEIPSNMPPETPLFPSLFVDICDQSLFEEELNTRLGEPVEYMQALLGAAGQPIASLHSLFITHHDLIKSRDLFAKNQLRILSHLANNILGVRASRVLN